MQSKGTTKVEKLNDKFLRQEQEERKAESFQRSTR